MRGRLRERLMRLLGIEPPVRRERAASTWAGDVAAGPLPVRDPGTHFRLTPLSDATCQPRSGCVCGSQPMGCAESQTGGETPC